MAKYLKQDCETGFIEDNAEIEYTQFCNLRHSILGCMMGDFDSQGRYVIAPEIVDELVKMPKYIVDSMDNIEVCASVIKLDKQLTFLVTFEGSRVTLSLMEKISFEGNIKLNSGTYSNINEYILDSIETSGAVNKNAIYAMWNISEFGGTALDVFNMDEQTIAAYFNIVNRFKYLMTANKILLENESRLEAIESNYANRILDILKAYPKLKEKVEQELKTTLSEKKDFIKIDKPNFAKTINEIIEKAIDNNIDVLNDKEKESFKQEKHQAQMETNILRREVVDITPKPIEVSKDNLNKDAVDLGPAVPVVLPVIETKGEENKPLDQVTADFVGTRTKVASDVKKDAVNAVKPKVDENPSAETGSKKKSGSSVPAVEGKGKAKAQPNPLQELAKNLTEMGVPVEQDLTTPDTKDTIKKETKKPKEKETPLEHDTAAPKEQAPKPVASAQKPATQKPAAKKPVAKKQEPAGKAVPAVEKPHAKRGEGGKEADGKDSGISMRELLNGLGSTSSDSAPAKPLSSSDNPVQPKAENPPVSSKPKDTTPVVDNEVGGEELEMSLLSMARERQEKINGLGKEFVQEESELGKEFSGEAVAFNLPNSQKTPIAKPPVNEEFKEIENVEDHGL